MSTAVSRTIRDTGNRNDGAGWSTCVLKAFGFDPHPTGSPISRNTRVRRMLFLFCLTVLVRIVYFIVLAPSTPIWTREELPRNGYLQIAEHLVAGEGYSTTSLLTYYGV